MRAHCKLHPKTSSALQFVCTSMDSSAVVSAKAYNEEEAIIILEQVNLIASYIMLGKILIIL